MDHDFFFLILGERQDMATQIYSPSTQEAKADNCHEFEADPGCVVNYRPAKPCCKKL